MRHRTAGYLGDLLDAGRAAVVQVDVQRDGRPLGQAEQDVQLPVHVTVDAHRIQSAEHVGALGQGLLQKLGRPRLGEQAELGEGHHLYIEQVGARGRGGTDAVHIGQPVDGRDVDMRTHGPGAAGDGAVHERTGAFLDGAGDAGDEPPHRRRSGPAGSTREYG